MVPRCFAASETQDEVGGYYDSPDKDTDIPSDYFSLPVSADQPRGSAGKRSRFSPRVNIPSIFPR